MRKNEKQQTQKNKEKRRRELRWEKLDNTAHLFPVIADSNMSNVYRISVTLKEEIRRELLQDALNLVLSRGMGSICG